ncbi:helix-turn-helix transcriptional regulator [Chelativorans salis]|uniref:HTH luxR-type domain-containing protein n=1 Tax=Chelativorans salis TaxID=2978478 RepID=A0ABT2LVX8_9HYPH|nr:hypothetical protein [Chelativorans sp. EGI FJ00035]MCT7378692.1 hypothetical protein [Chelativorans sp. EGI FJ00035]
MRYEAALDLVGSIYDAAFEPELWPQLLVRVSDAVGGVQECLQAYSPKSHSFAMIAPRRDPDYKQNFRDHWMKVGFHDGFARMAERLLAAPAGRVLDFRELYPTAEFSRTALYNEWWQRQRLGQAALVVNLTTSDRAWQMCGLHKRPNEDFSDEEIALFKAIAPHLARAFSLQSEIAHLAAREDIGVNSSRPGKGTICLDRDANIVFADDEAEALFKSIPELGLEQGRLSPAQPDVAAALDRLIASCADLKLEPGGPGGSIILTRGHARPPVTIEVLPTGMTAARRDIGVFGLLRPVAILTIVDAERELAERRKELQEKFGLTPAEATFTLEILKGDGREAAAARCGIAVSTARTHLHRIFDKVGVRRQAELVRLLAGGADRKTRFRTR